MLSVLSLAATGQTTYVLTGTNNKATITGTSSLHDWDEDIAQFNSDFRIIKDGAAVKSIENVSFSCAARDIKSDNSLMNRKTYEALKADEHPQIKFLGSGVSGLLSEGAKFKGTLSGKLTVAGQTRDMTIPFTGTLIDNKNIDITANAEMSFSSFGMKPPTAMMGALKTGDKLKLSFNLHYSEKK